MTGIDAKAPDILSALKVAIEDDDNDNGICPTKVADVYAGRKPEGKDGGQTIRPPLHGESHWIHVAKKDQRAGLPNALKVR